MTERMSSAQFCEFAGVEDWRVLWGAGYACACFQAGSFGAGAALVQAISELAAAANHHPDIDLCPEGVTVRLCTRDAKGLTERDVDLARRISAAARDLHIPADPAAMQHAPVAIDALDIPRVRPSGMRCSATTKSAARSCSTRIAADRRSGSSK